MKNCLNCAFLPNCSIAKLIVERELFAEEEPLAGFACNRHLLSPENAQQHLSAGCILAGEVYTYACKENLPITHPLWKAHTAFVDKAFAKWGKK